MRKADDRSCRSRTSACQLHTTAVEHTAAAAEESPVVALAARAAELEAAEIAAAAVGMISMRLLQDLINIPVGNADTA